MKDYAVNLLENMLKIYSPSGKERGISEFLFKEMRHLGFNVWRDEVGNVYGEGGKGTVRILLCGHMDTVPGNIQVRWEGNKLYGRGAVDAKAPLAAMIIAASRLLNVNIQGRILVCGVVDEEGSGTGIKHLVKNIDPVNYAIFGEPSGIDKIVIGYKGRLLIKLIVKTETGHSAASWLYENAIEKAYDIWNGIQQIKFSDEKAGSRFYSITSCLTKITGGGKFSTVPSNCEMHLDLRIPPQISITRVYDKIGGLLKKYQKGNPNVSIAIEILEQIHPYETVKTSPIVGVLARAIRKITKKRAMVLRKTGTGDMNVFGNSMGVPVVTYGPGNSQLDHTPNEHINIQDYLESIQVYQETIGKLLE